MILQENWQKLLPAVLCTFFVPSPLQLSYQQHPLKPIQTPPAALSAASSPGRPAGEEGFIMKQLPPGAAIQEPFSISSYSGKRNKLNFRANCLKAFYFDFGRTYSQNFGAILGSVNSNFRTGARWTVSVRGKKIRKQELTKVHCKES